MAILLSGDRSTSSLLRRWGWEEMGAADLQAGETNGHFCR